MGVKNGVSGGSSADCCLEILEKPPSEATRLSHRLNRSIAGTGARGNEALGLVILLWALYLKGLLYF